jgi:hypothetical protein
MILAKLAAFLLSLFEYGFTPDPILVGFGIVSQLLLIQYTTSPPFPKLPVLSITRSIYG